MNNTQDYNILIGLMIRLIESQAGEPITKGKGWLNDSQTLSIKLFRHLISMPCLATGATIEKNSIPTLYHIDHSSIKVIARAALETYLVFFYLYGDGVRQTSKYRHITWKLSGLIERQKSFASLDEHKKVLDEELSTIESLRTSLSKYDDFELLNEKHKKQILLGKWRVGKTWSDLGVSAGFHEVYFKNIYSYLCGYSHSSYISALQVGQAQSIEDQEMLTHSILDIGLIVMAHFIHSYSNLYLAASKVLMEDVSAREVVDRWRFKAEDMEVIYGDK